MRLLLWGLNRLLDGIGDDFMAGPAQMNAVVDKESIAVVVAGGIKGFLCVREAGVAVAGGGAASQGELVRFFPAGRRWIRGEDEHVRLSFRLATDAVNGVAAGLVELLAAHAGVPVIPTEEDRDEVGLGHLVEPPRDQHEVLPQLSPADCRVVDRHSRLKLCLEPAGKQVDPADLAVGPVPAICERVAECHDRDGLAGAELGQDAAQGRTGGSELARVSH